MKKLILIVLSLCSVAYGQVTPNNHNSNLHSTGTSYSQNFTVTAGTNLAAVAFVGWDDNGGNKTGLTVTCTLGGASMTAVGTVVNGGSGGYDYWEQAFILTNPTTGASVTLACTATSGAYEINANVATFTGVNQTTPVRPNTYGTAVSNVNYGIASVLVPSQPGDLVVSGWAGGQSISTNQTSYGFVSAGGGSFAAAAAINSGPSLEFGWGQGGGTSWSLVYAFSLQATYNATVLKTINGATIGALPGQIHTLNGVNIGSAVSGYVKTINGIATPAGTRSINSFINPTLGGTSGSAPTLTTLANSTSGDYLYYNWNIGGLGAGMIYSNGIVAPNPPVALSDNNGATWTSPGTIGFKCTTGVSTHCGLVFANVSDWGPSTSAAYWFYSTCTGGGQDCGSQMSFAGFGGQDGFGIHADSGVCSNNGWSMDPGAFGVPQCLTGTYAPNTWYRINMQWNSGQANFTATFSTSTPVITATQTLSANQAVIVSNSGGALPAGLAAQTTYYVLPASLSGSGFELSTVQNGAPIQVTTTGSGTNTFATVHQGTICSSTGALIGTLYIPTSTTTYNSGQIAIGIGGEEPNVNGFLYYYFGLVLDGAGKFSGTACW